MGIQVGEIMESDVVSIGASASVAQLGRMMLDHRVSGLPVVEGGQLIGVVSRSDIIRKLEVERTQEAQFSDFYRQISSSDEVAADDMIRLGAKVGARLEGMSVADVMVKEVITLESSASLKEAARKLVDHNIHRLPIVENGRLIGILTGLRLVQLIADGELD